MVSKKARMDILLYALQAWSWARICPAAVAYILPVTPNSRPRVGVSTPWRLSRGLGQIHPPRGVNAAVSSWLTLRPNYPRPTHTRGWGFGMLDQMVLRPPLARGWVPEGRCTHGGSPVSGRTMKDHCVVEVSHKLRLNEGLWTMYSPKPLACMSVWLTSQNANDSAPARTFGR